MITALRSRTTRLVALVASLAFAIVAIGTPAAFAWVPPDGPNANPSTLPNPTSAVVTSLAATPTQASSASGLAIWLVVVIGIAALAVGVALAEFGHALIRNRQVRRPAAATS